MSRGEVVAMMMTASAADSLGSARTLARADTPALRTRGSARMAMMTDAVDDRGDLPGRWADIDGLLLRGGPVTGPGFEPGEDVKTVLHDMMHILVVGAGGLGCELLKDLALSGFKKIDVIDMDTIDVSNLNRQFLFRPADVGRSKAEVAAARVSERVDGVVVTPHHGRIEDKPDEFYEQFHVIVLGLDSLEARSYLNAVACGFLRYEESADDDALMGDDPNQSPALAVDQSTIKPLIDGGTEGFKGHARVILPGVTPCFECTSWLFPPQKNFPLCTLAETPRNAAHCIEYARLIQWPKQRPDDTFDADEPEHVKWVYDLAAKRAATFDIPGVTLSHTLGVVKNIIPAIPSTNAIVAAECATEALKLATCCAPGMDNFAMYVGTSGVYTHTVKYEKDEACELCSAGRRVAVSKDATLSDVMDALVAAFQGKVDAPSVTLAGGANLYLRGPLEEEFKPNLGLKMVDLIGQGEGGGEAAKEAMLVVNDKKMKRPTRVRLRLE